MARKVVGIDIDFSGIKCAELIKKGRTRLVTKLANQSLPANIFTDGKVEDITSLAQSLNEMFARYKLSNESVVLGIRSPWVYTKLHQFPKMPKRELEKALEFEIASLVSFPVNSPRDLTYDYFVNSELGDQLELLIVACPRKRLDPYISALKQADLRLAVVDVPAFSWNYLFAEEKSRAFVEVSAEQTTVFIAERGLYKILRVVPIGMVHFLEGVQEAFALSSQEAFALMQKQDLDYLLMEGTANKRVLRATIQQLIGSILQTLDFVRAKERATQFRALFDELVICGELADLPGLCSMLEKELNLSVLALSQVEHFSFTFDALPPSRFSTYASALALALRGFVS